MDEMLLIEYRYSWRKTDGWFDGLHFVCAVEKNERMWHFATYIHLVVQSRNITRIQGIAAFQANKSKWCKPKLSPTIQETTDSVSLLTHTQLQPYKYKMSLFYQIAIIWNNVNEDSVSISNLNQRVHFLLPLCFLMLSIVHGPCTEDEVL